LGAALGINAATPLGLNSIRADLGAFFLASAIACGLALFAKKPNWLWGAMSLYLIAVIGRVLGVVIDGAPAGVAQPIIIELVIVAMLGFGARTLGRS
jgi:ABC-type multidrug transport system permease subunit